MAEVVRVEGLHKSFKKGFIPRKQEVLRGVDFTVSSGVITGFLGANGAGKTTTMKSLLGLAFPDQGSITFLAINPSHPKLNEESAFCRNIRTSTII